MAEAIFGTIMLSTAGSSLFWRVVETTEGVKGREAMVGHGLGEHPLARLLQPGPRDQGVAVSPSQLEP